MMLRLLPLLGALGLLGLITSCGTTSSIGTTGPTPEPAAKKTSPARFDPAAPTLVIALDASESMLESDPGRFSVEGARLAGALVDTGANVGVLSFHRRSHTWFPLSSLRGAADRERLEEAVGKIRFRGQTDFKSALEASYEMLAKRKARPGSAVLFLTDGRPDLGSDEASEENLGEAIAALEPFKARGYRIFTIGLGPEVNAELLNRMSAETGAPPTWLVGDAGGKGSHEDAKKLLSAFLQVTGDVSRYLEFDEGLAPVEIFPGTRKLVYVLVRDDPETGFGEVSRDGKAVADSTLYRYPRLAKSDSRFEVVFVERPPEGIWHAQVHGDPDIGAILEDVALDVSLVEPKRKDLFIGQPVPLAIDVRFDHPGWKTILAERARATVELVSAETRKVIAKDLVLLGKGAGPGRVRFAGGPAARMSRPGGPERVFANVKFTLTRRTKGESSRTFSTSVTVRPHPDAHLTVVPDVLDLGSRWVDDVAGQHVLEVTNPTGAPVSVTVAPGQSCTAEPTSFTLESGASRKVTVRLGGSLGAGELRDGIVLTAAPQGPTAKVLHVKVPVRATLYSLVPGEDVNLGSAAVDPDGARDVALDIPLEIRPATPGLFEFESSGLRGPAKLAARVETAGTRGKLIFRLPRDAAKGVYETTLTVTARAETLRPRTLTGRLEVWTMPEVEVDPGDQVRVTALGSREVDSLAGLTLRYPAEVSLEFAKGELEPAGGGPGLTADDYELVPEDGWDGKALAADERRVLIARIYVSSDVRNGVYAGSLEVTLKSPGRPDGHATVPVVLKVAR